MNLAFGTTLVLLILLPGVAFRRFLFYGDYSKRFTKTTAYDEFIWALIPGIIIQILGTWLVNNIQHNYLINLPHLGFLLLGAKDDKIIESAFTSVSVNLGCIILYNLILITLAGITGYLIRYFIRKCHWDHKYKPCRFNNEWFYFLRGEFVFFTENRITNINQIDNCFIDSMVKLGTEIYIYAGIIHSFTLGTDGGLDNIAITGAQRKKINEPDFYPIPGHVVVIKSSEIINLNVRVIDLSADIKIKAVTKENSLQDKTEEVNK